MTQAKAAARLGWSLKEWLKAEKDPAPAGAPLDGRVGKLKAFERCLLMRLRVGLSQQEVAEKAGFCRTYVCAMERGDVACDSLVWFWEQ